MKPNKPGTVISSDADTSLDWVYQQGVTDRVLAKMQANLKEKASRRRRVSRGLAAVAVVCVGLFWLLPLWRDTGNLKVPAASRQELVLADGSRVEVNARTSLRTDFRYGRRVVSLERGEAFFSVAKDTGHPFVVETPVGTVRVTGTQFNVRLTSEKRVEVSLVEGSVLVRPAHANEVALVPARQITFDAETSALRTMSTAEMEAVVAWRKGTLILDGLTLAEAATRIADYHGCEIELVGAVGRLTPGGSVPLDDLRAALRAIELALPIRVIHAGEGRYRLVAR